MGLDLKVTLVVQGSKVLILFFYINIKTKFVKL